LSINIKVFKGWIGWRLLQFQWGHGSKSYLFCSVYFLKTIFRQLQIHEKTV
jgi:hypothetical protein